MIEISRTKSWMKRVGSWYSDAWNYLANIQELITTLVSGQTSAATRLPIYTKKMVLADTEYSQRLPDHTKGYTIQTTDGAAFRFSTEPGRVAKAKRPFWTVPANTSDDEDGLDLVGVIFYFAASVADKTIEIKVKV